MHIGVKLLLCAVLSYGQTQIPVEVPSKVHNGLTENIGNFSIELLHSTSLLQPQGQNMIMSPITVWTAMAVIAEGASGDTKNQIKSALRLRLPMKYNESNRQQFAEIAQWLIVNTTTVTLAKFNGIFVDNHTLPKPEFQETAKTFYDTNMVTFDFSYNENAANLLNAGISNFTHGRIPKIVESSYFKDASMFLTSAVYFKGQWTAPFNASNTAIEPFYDSKGKKIGEVNMMYNRYTYPFSRISKLQARVIELPYGKENRLSMAIMLPDHGVSVEDMFKNFGTISLDSLFEEMRLSKEEYSDEEVDCFIPRFKIESNIDLTDVLKSRFNVTDLFVEGKAKLPYLARFPLHVSKIVHKAEIEVTEEGTTASAVTVAEFVNRIGVVRFEANRPFAYMIIEKVTNTIVFGGVYKLPSLY